jgi:hypothetical protein
MAGEPDEVEAPTWRIRAGAGLPIHSPLNPALREAHRREDERAAQRAQLEAELRQDRDLERAAELRRQGHELHSVADTLAKASFGADRQDAVERRREREAAEVLGKPAESRFDKWESKANVAAAEARRETTAATQADLRELQSEVTGLKSALHAVKRKLRR